MRDQETERKPSWLSDHYYLMMRERKEDRALTSIHNEIYTGETIRSPKNSTMLFNNCEFENCTFIIKS